MQNVFCIRFHKCCNEYIIYVFFLRTFLGRSFLFLVLFVVGLRSRLLSCQRKWRGGLFGAIQFNFNLILIIFFIILIINNYYHFDYFIIVLYIHVYAECYSGQRYVRLKIIVSRMLQIIISNIMAHTCSASFVCNAMIYVASFLFN